MRLISVLISKYSSYYKSCIFRKNHDDHVATTGPFEGLKSRVATIEGKVDGSTGTVARLGTLEGKVTGIENDITNNVKTSITTNENDIKALETKVNDPISTDNA